MWVTTETDERTTTTAGGAMSALATPSVGSTELSTWRVRMHADVTGPVHAIDREQVWMPVSGTFEITIDGVAETMSPGQAAILPAGVERLIRTVDGPAEALVCMTPGGMARVPGAGSAVPLPWAQ
jgi:quercetin dioxygenase-like cupin family protein